MIQEDKIEKNNNILRNENILNCAKFPLDKQKSPTQNCLKYKNSSKNLYSNTINARKLKSESKLEKLNFVIEDESIPRFHIGKIKNIMQDSSSKINKNTLMANIIKKVQKEIHYNCLTVGKPIVSDKNINNKRNGDTKAIKFLKLIKNHKKQTCKENEMNYSIKNEFL